MAWCRGGRGVACALAGALVGCGTVPPVNPGFVDTRARRAGQVDASAVAGVGLACIERCSDPLGAGSLHVDPFVLPRLSLPLEAALVDMGARDGTVAVPTRLGLRQRFADTSFGAGFGPTFMSGLVGANVDLEAAVGFDAIGRRFSLAFRPTYAIGQPTGASGGNDSAVYVPVELAAMVDVGAGFALGVHALGGLALVSRYVVGADRRLEHHRLSDVAGALGAGLGVVWGAPGHPAAPPPEERAEPARRAGRAGRAGRERAERAERRGRRE